VACYRDALVLFLDFATHKLHKVPTSLTLPDIQPDLNPAFPDQLEHERNNAIRIRNLMLTASRVFLKFTGRRDVTSLHFVEQARAVPMKRFERPILGFLTREEMLAVLGQPGRRGLRRETICCRRCSTTRVRASRRADGAFVSMDNPSRQSRFFGRLL